MDRGGRHIESLIKLKVLSNHNQITDTNITMKRIMKKAGITLLSYSTLTELSLLLGYSSLNS